MFFFCLLKPSLRLTKRRPLAPSHHGIDDDLVHSAYRKALQALIYPTLTGELDLLYPRGEEGGEGRVNLRGREGVRVEWELSGDVESVWVEWGLSGECGGGAGIEWRVWRWNMD